MRRAKKTKTDVTQTEEIINERIAAAKGGQVAKNVPPLLHTGVAAAPAPADKLQEQLEAAQFEVFCANTLDDMCQVELAKAEKQHALNLKMYYARLERWAREARSKKPPCPSLVIKRHDKNTAFEHESVVNVMAVRYVAMYGSEVDARRGCVGKADDARILIVILKRRVRQLSKCQKSQSRARKARAED